MENFRIFITLSKLGKVTFFNILKAKTKNKCTFSKNFGAKIQSGEAGLSQWRGPREFPAAFFSSLSFGNWGGPTNRFCSLKNFSPEGKSVALENNGEFLTDHVYGFFLASSKTHHRMRGRSEKIILTHATLSRISSLFLLMKVTKIPVFTFNFHILRFNRNIHLILILSKNLNFRAKNILEYKIAQKGLSRVQRTMGKSWKRKSDTL